MPALAATGKPAEPVTVKPAKPAKSSSSGPQNVAAVPVGARDGLAMVQRFIHAGAYALALTLVHDHQPKYTAKPQAWFKWEQVKFALLRKQHAWKAISAETSRLPSSLSWPQRAEFVTLGAKADLAQLHGRRAQRLLRSLLWSPRGLPSNAQLRVWRRLLIESYLVDGQLNDARLALLNYQLDYTAGSGAERAVLARVWLRVHEPRRAVELLSTKLQPATHWLYWLASLRAGSMAPKTVIAQAVKAAAAKGLDARRQAQLWGVAASAALKEHDWPAAINALEHFLALTPRLPLTPLLPFDGDTLWHAYHAYGIQAGNRAKLLIGDDAAWEAAVRQAQSKGHPLLARAYNAILAQAGQNTRARDTGYRWLGISLLGMPHGRRLLDRLFLHAPKHFPNVGAIPVIIRLVLANDAVDRGALSLAARLMQGVNKAPGGENPYLWSLRMARVMVLGGKPNAGIARLQTLIARKTAFDRKQADQLMQVLFDLQSRKHNAASIKLFAALYPKLKQAQLQREVLFWEAQSLQALGNQARAARLYLQSAMLLDGKAYGPWGMTARYNAALAMSKAGMIGGAIRVLEDLRTHTHDPAQLSVLKKKLTELQRLPRSPAR